VIGEVVVLIVGVRVLRHAVERSYQWLKSDRVCCATEWVEWAWRIQYAAVFFWLNQTFHNA